MHSHMDTFNYTKKTDVCRHTPTGFTHIAMNTQACIEAQIRVDESEYTHGIGGAVQHCLLTYEDTFFTFYIINVIQLVLVSCHNYIRSLPTPSHHKLCSGLLLLDTDWSVDKT